MKEKILILLVVAVAFFLRFYMVEKVPPGLYQDEVSIGTNAYSILTTGKDEYGEPMPLYFKALSDYKLPGYIYTTSASMAIFGKTELAIRLPSVLAGTITVLLLYLTLRRLLEREKLNSQYLKIAPFLASFLLAISPWHIQFSRAGFEANLALFFYMAGLTLFLYLLNNKKFTFLIFSSISLALSVYSYHSFKLIAPLTFIAIIYLTLRKFPKEKYKTIASLFVFAILIFPQVALSTSVGTERLSQTSAFSELGELDSVQKIYKYPALFVKNYLSYFSFDFLFDRGDGIGRHQVGNFGPLFKWQLPFILAGIYFLLSRKNKILFLILGILAIAPIPAAIAAPSPHTLRSLTMVIPFVILASFGLLFVYQKLVPYKKLLVPLVIAVVFYEFLFYSHYYYVHYPQVNLLDWGGAQKELSAKAGELSNNFDEIIVDKNVELAGVYLKYYQPNLRYELVDVTWKKPDSWKNKKVLYIRPYYGQEKAEGIIHNVRLSNKAGDIFAQFWSI